MNSGIDFSVCISVKESLRLFVSVYILCLYSKQLWKNYTHVLKIVPSFYILSPEPSFKINIWYIIFCATYFCSSRKLVITLVHHNRGSHCTLLDESSPPSQQQLLSRTVLKHPATRQSIAWLGPFGLACIAVSDLHVTSIKLLSWQ